MIDINHLYQSQYDNGASLAITHSDIKERIIADPDYLEYLIHLSVCQNYGTDPLNWDEFKQFVL